MPNMDITSHHIPSEVCNTDAIAKGVVNRNNSNWLDKKSGIFPLSSHRRVDENNINPIFTLFFLLFHSYRPPLPIIFGSDPRNSEKNVWNFPRNGLTDVFGMCQSYIQLTWKQQTSAIHFNNFTADSQKNRTNECGAFLFTFSHFILLSLQFLFVRGFSEINWWIFIFTHLFEERQRDNFGFVNVVFVFARNFLE